MVSQQRDGYMPCQLERTREFVEQSFRHLDPHTTFPLREAALIRDGQYCGHRFSSGELTAVWFFEENQVKIFDHDRHLLKVSALAVEQYRRAA